MKKKNQITKATKRGGKFTWERATEDELDELARIMESDVLEAKAFAKKYGSKRLNALLDADKPDAE